MLTHGTYLIDTDVCIELTRKNPIVVEHVRAVGAFEYKISDVTLAEMYFGAFKSGREKHFNDVTVINGLFESYTIRYLRKYGELRCMLESKGLKIGDMGILRPRHHPSHGFMPCGGFLYLICRRFCHIAL